MMRRAVLLCGALLLPAAALAQAPDVYTRGEYRGSFEEDGGKRLYARIKIAPGAKIPFSTHNYRVPDRKMLEGMQDGMQVEFKTRREGGENLLTALRHR